MYEGYYFDVQINGFDAVAMKGKDSIHSLQEFPRYSSVQWMIDYELSGDLYVEARNNDISYKFIGSVGSDNDLDVTIYPLEGQDLSTREGSITSKDVSINGKHTKSDVDVMTNRHLPAGDYVISVKTHGSDNWDRKFIFVRFH